MPSHREVAHNWAHQTGKACRGANMFYEGATIYSWGHHWPIARITQDRHGVTVVLINTDKRSISTSQHTSIVQRATSHMPTLVTPAPTSSIAHNIQILGQRIKLRYEELQEMREEKSRALVPIVEKLIVIATARDQAIRLALAFDAQSELRSINATHVEYAELREWAESKRTLLYERTAERDAKRAANERKAALAARPKTKAKLRKWLAGGDTFPLMKRIWCRVKGDRLETSQGASVPLAIAKRVFVLAENARSTNRSFADPNYQVGLYKGLGITHLGTIVVGCHRIPFHTARIAARQAGID